MMRLARFILILAAGGAVLAPLCALGHGSEFLSAKLTLLPDAEVLLEVTADYGSNPMISDEPAALDALADPVRVRHGEMLVPLATLGAASISRQQKWDEHAPSVYQASDTGNDEAHALITSTWRWRSAGPEVVFEMPQDKLHDVLLWTHDGAHPNAEPKWMILQAGDRSRAIAIQLAPWWRGWMAAAGAGGLLLLGAYFVSRNFTLRQRTL
jgi:hypothetical protein